MGAIANVPSLTGEPVFGSLRQFQRDRLGFLLRLRRDLGDVAHFRLMWKNVFLLSRPDAIKHVLVDHYKRYPKGQPYDRLEPILGKGLLTSEGDFWLRQRRLVQPAFHHRRLDALAPVMIAAVSEMLQDWDALAESGRPIDIHAEMMRLTLSIIGRALYSVDLGKKAAETRETMDVLLKQLHNRVSNPFYLPAILPTARDTAYRRALAALDRIVYSTIAERRRLNIDRNDLLSTLIQTTDEGSTMTDAQLRDEVATLILAGHETTATTLSWTWHLLSRHPQVERALHEELSGRLSGNLPELQDLPELPYSQMVIQESLRLYPPAWLIPRTAAENDTIDDAQIPAGSIVFMSPYVTHRHPDLWENPEGFDPERFTTGRSDGRPDYAYFPFGGGPHKCIGFQFALLETQIVLAMVAQRYRLELAPGYPAVPQPTVTLRPRDGVWMRLKKK